MAIRIIGGNFSGNRKGGVNVESGDVEITRATADNNKGDGFRFGENANIKAVSLSASGNAEQGINIQSALPSVPIAPTPVKNSFWEHPLTKWGLGVIGSIIVAFVIWYFGLK